MPATTISATVLIRGCEEKITCTEGHILHNELQHGSERCWGIMTVDNPDRPKGLSPGRLLSGLSPLEFDVLKRLRQNMQHSAIAQELGLSASQLTSQIRQILARIGARDRAELLMIVDGLGPSGHRPPRSAAV
jgi:DNA-binding CsgD family transcriptional regulator